MCRSLCVNLVTMLYFILFGWCAAQFDPSLIIEINGNQTSITPVNPTQPQPLSDGFRFASGTISSSNSACQHFEFPQRNLTLDNTGFTATIVFQFIGSGWNSWERLFDFGVHSWRTKLVFARHYGDATVALQTGVDIGESWDTYRFMQNQVLQNTIYRLAIVYNPNIGSAGEVQFWSNGSFVESQTQQNRPMNITNERIFVGKSNWPDDGCLNAIIYSLRLYNRVLPQWEMARDLQLPFTAAPSTTARTTIIIPSTLNTPLITSTSFVTRLVSTPANTDALTWTSTAAVSTPTTAPTTSTSSVSWIAVSTPVNANVLAVSYSISAATAGSYQPDAVLTTSIPTSTISLGSKILFTHVADTITLNEPPEEILTNYNVTESSTYQSLLDLTGNETATIETSNAISPKVTATTTLMVKKSPVDLRAYLLSYFSRHLILALVACACQFITCTIGVLYLVTNRRIGSRNKYSK